MHSEIRSAVTAHSSIREDLKGTPILLRFPVNEILHKLGSAKNTQSWLDDDFQYNAMWSKGGDHYLLMEMLQIGHIPFASLENPTHPTPPTVTEALKTAISRGYFVNEGFLNGRETSHSEKEAFLASLAIVSGTAKSIWLNYADHERELNGWRSLVCLVSGQYIVPDPFYENKTPYVLDQLWIVKTSNNDIRLLGVEIDGETHLTEEGRLKDKERDLKLAALGYEIYHVAGWWCRIDPYRVICEFLKASRLCSSSVEYLIGKDLSSINDYKCVICGYQMVRADDDWLQYIDEGPYSGFAHRCCEEGLREDGYYSQYCD